MADAGWKTRAAGLHALTLGGTAPQVVSDALCATEGDDLRHLLAALDEQGDHRDLEWIVFDYLGAAQRAAVLAHVAAASADWPSQVHVVADVDDTIFASIHDNVYPDGTLYPGVLEFLTRCGRGAPIIVVTARPQVLEDSLRRRLHNIGLAGVPVLSGSLRRVFSDAAMAARKSVNLEHLMALHPRDRFVLVGDDGQGDVHLARQAIARWGDRIAAVFIHHVKPGALPQDEDIQFFRDYAQAARRARALGLLTRSEADAVIRAAKRATLKTDVAGDAVAIPAA